MLHLLLMGFSSCCLILKTFVLVISMIACYFLLYIFGVENNCPLISRVGFIFYGKTSAAFFFCLGGELIYLYSYFYNE